MPDSPPMVEQRHYGLLSSPWQPGRSGSLEMTQPGHVLEQRGTNPGGTRDIKGKGDLPSPIQSVCPVPPHHSWLLCRFALWFSSGHPAAGLGERRMVAHWCHQIEAQALPPALGTLHRPQPLGHLCLGWISKKKIPAFSERVSSALVLVKQLTPLF